MIKVLKQKIKNVWGIIRKHKTAYLFLSPWLILFCTFTVYPLIMAFIYSFHDVRVLRNEMTFVGLENYINVLNDELFHLALKNTVFFVVGTIPFTTVIAMLLALAVNRKIPFQGLFRVGFFLPTVTSIIVIALMFNLLYAPSGVLNLILQKFGFEPVRWLLQENTALPSIMAMNVWTAVGFYMLIYLAALQAIPKQLYEAAVVDGASRFRQFWHVTLPHLRQITILVVVINLINSFQVFAEIYTMTGGGPLNSTTTIVFYLYNKAFSQGSFGEASATAYILFFIILVASMISLRLFGINRGVGDSK